MRKKDSHLRGFLDSLRRRQKNIVFPDTIQNESEGFRRIYEGKRPLTLAQFIGMTAMIIVTTLYISGILGVFWLYLREGQGAVTDRLVHILAAFSFVLIPLGVFFYFLRRSLSRERRN